MGFSKNIVARRLKEARQRIGLSQKNLGIAAGIDEFSASSRMNQYETGKHVPDLLTLKQISKVLKVPLAYFYADEPKYAELLLVFSSLNKAQQEKVLLFINNLHNK